MTAFELRHHLAAGHGIDFRGAPFAAMSDWHEQAHRDGTDHDHQDSGR